MAVLLEKSSTYIFNSDTVAGAQNVSADGSMFQVTTASPITIPRDAIDCKIGVIQANIWNTSPNIAVAFSNNLFKFTTTVAPAGTHTITIPDGLYSVAALTSYLSSQFVNLTYPSNLITIAGDDATGFSTVTFLTSGDSADFTIANTVRDILGFAAVVITAPSANYTFFSTSQAQFNRVNSYIIASNIVANGIQVNSNPTGIIATVPIDAPPGSQIAYSPQNIAWFSGDEMIGSSKSNFMFMLQDQNLRATPTGGNTWSFTLVISYSKFLSTGVLIKS